jgi:predicted SprT family Zn-dependent metalloprotease
MISPAKSGKGSSTKRSLAAAKKTALAAKREFDEKKLSVAERFLKELDELVTGSEIHKLAAPTGGVRVVWTKTLNTTAGRANWKREIIRKKNQPSSQEEISAQFRGGSSTDVSFSASRSTSPGETTNMTPESAGEAGHTIRHHATIELAEKVIDSEDRLLSTLAHEYCHLANFMISNVRDNPHGASFKAWAAKCRKALASHPVYGPYKIDITTKHSYEINFKYLWCCTQCGHEYGRHSKSVDPKKHRCSRCDKGLLVQVRPKPRKQKNGIVSENKENRDPRDNVIDLT